MANIRIPVSKGASGNSIKIPEVSEFLENSALSNALSELGKSLSKFSKNESIRSDRFLLGSSNLEGIINSSISQTQDFEVYDANGRIDYSQSIQKSNNIIESSAETWEQAKYIALQEVENLPWRTREVKSSALATVAGHFNATNSKSINKTLLAQSDNLKEQWIISLLTDANYYPDVPISSVMDLVTSTAESMSKPSKAKTTIMNLTSNYVQQNSVKVSGATEILTGSENPILQSFFTANELTAKNTIKRAVGLTSLKNNETRGSITAITTKSLEDFSLLNASIPADNKNKLWFETTLTAARSLFEVNSDAYMDANAVMAGQKINIRNPILVDYHLGATNSYDQLTLPQLASVIKSFADSTETMPSNLADKIDQFISKPDFQESELNFINALADLYNKNGLQGLSDDSQNKLEVYIANPAITDRADRLKSITNIENVKFTDSETLVVESMLRSPQATGWFPDSFYDSEIEQLLEENAQEKGWDWDDITRAGRNNIARSLNRSIINNAKIYKMSTGLIEEVNTDALIKKSLDEVLRKIPIIKAANSEKPIVIPFQLNIKDLNGNPAQIPIENVLELYRHLATNFVREDDPSLSGGDLREKVENMLPDLMVTPNPMNIGTYSVRTEAGSDIGVLDPQLLVQDYFDPSAVILPDELLPGDLSLLPQGSLFTLDEKNRFDSWKYKQQTEQAIKEYPFKNQAADIIASKDFKKLSVEEQFEILNNIGDSLVKQSSANTYLRIPRFRELYIQGYENYIGDTLNDSVLVEAKYSDIENPDNIDPNLIVDWPASGYRKKLLETSWFAPRPDFVDKDISDETLGEAMEKVLYGRKAKVWEGDGRDQWIYDLFDETVETYTAELMTSTDKERRIVYNQANSTLISSLDLSIEHYTPVGILQGYEKHKDFKNKTKGESYLKVFKSKLDRLAEVKEPNFGSTIIQNLVPTDESIYAIIESNSNATLVKRMPLIPRLDADEIQKAINDINGLDDIARLQVMAIAENDKEMQQIIAGMRDKRFNAFVKKLLKERVLSDGLQ